MRKLSTLALALVAVSGVAHAHDLGSNTATPVTDVEKQQKVRFYGLGLDYSLYDGTGLNAVNYSNEIDMYFIPSWAIGKLAFRGTRFERLTLTGRWTLSRTIVGYDPATYAANSDLGPPQPCSNITPSTNGGVVDPTTVQRCPYNQNHRWDYGDIWFTLGNPKIYTIPKLLININPSIRFVVPTSLESQYQTLLLGLTGTLGVSRDFWGDKFTLGYSFGFTKNFHRYTTPQGQNDSLNGDSQVGYANNYDVSNAISPGDALNPFNQTSAGARNTSYGFTHIFSASLNPNDKWSITVLYILTDAFHYPTPDTFPVNGQDYNTYNSGMAVAANSGTEILKTGHVDNQWFWATVGYQALDWLNLSVALITISPQRFPDGSLRQPFISTNYDAFSQLSFGATVSLEKAAARLF